MIADATSGPFIALWSAIYLVLLITLGILSLRKGLFWLIGALLPRRVL